MGFLSVNLAATRIFPNLLPAPRLYQRPEENGW